ncbi:uncharacterized protein TA18140 [Theileria annulata]|uniref:Uncharacterized protein n=1 Tax=Theileria annulata TaxID=5874 RepID=Q4UB23_THEAN|nr:uncharacterized protein TA18140 [Theileria annulata]CAI75978.1 hypothetical protein TA18140 [Theileria annulata]|eukprot:XP_955454.1 hypothetical protein TA18140 [Theileria annulata]
MKDISLYIDNRLRKYMLDMNKIQNSDNIFFNLIISIPNNYKIFLIILKMKIDANFKNGLRDTTQLSRLILYEICDIMIYPLDDNRIVLIQTNKTTIIKKKLDEILLNDFEYTMKRINGDDQILSRCFIFTLLCNMLKTGKWIHVGKSMDYLISSNFKHSNDKNSIAFSCNIENIERILNEQKLKITIKMIIYIVLINNIQPNNINKIIGNMVLCLPKCNSYAKINSYKNSNNNKDFLISYWRKTNGYYLEEKDVEIIVNVTFKNTSYDYPLILLLKNQITILPFKTQQYKQSTINKIFNDIESLGEYKIEYIKEMNKLENEIDELSYKLKWISQSKTKLLLPPINTYENKNFRKNKLPPIEYCIKNKLPPIEYCIKNKLDKSDDFNIDNKNILTNQFWSNVNQQIDKFI